MCDKIRRNYFTREDLTKCQQDATILTRPDQTRPDQTVNCDFLYRKDYHSKELNISHLTNKTLSFRIIQDGYIQPVNSCRVHGLFDSEGKYANGSSFREGGGWPQQDGQDNLYIIPPKIADSAEHKHEKVIYVGALLKMWGHFITDSMRLLWFLRSGEYKEKYSEYPITYIPMHNFKAEGSYKRLLEILGVNISLLTPITSLVSYDKIILPDECFFIADETRCFTQEYVEMIDCVRNYALANIRPTSAKKVYYSYSRYNNGKSIGEDKLEKYFASKGYEVIYPETLSLDEQLNILANCESFASTIGSCSHNMVFLKDDSEVIMIPRANYLTGYQTALNQVHRQDIILIDSSMSFLAGKSPWGGPFLYFISSNLRRYFHDEDTESIVDASDFWKYMRSSFGFNFSRNFGKIASADNPNVYKYYSTVAAEYFSKLTKMSWPYRLRQFIKRLLRKNRVTP